MLRWAGCTDLDIRPKAYTADIDRLQEDLRRASMLLMPSRSEGFGLIATESIAAGVPVLVSEHSGVAELLRELLGKDAAPFIVPIHNDLDQNAVVWAEHMNFILLDQRAADGRARQLDGRLRETLTWSNAAYHSFRLNRHRLHGSQTA
jgi:glycosyltransferase involved in cell wall biosynthesis